MATINSMGAFGYRQALMELDCLPFHVQLSHHAPIHMMRTKTTVRSTIQNHTGHAKLGRQLSHTLRQGADVSFESLE